MKIQIGEIYMDEVGNKGIIPNKTRKYLLPCMKEYGDIFIGKLNSVFKVACGIGDIVVEKSGLNYERHLFLLLDSKLANKFFLKFMEWIREQSYYEDDYVYGNIQKSTFHMVVLKIPEQCYEALDIFKKSKYSEMYSYGDIDKYFHNHPDIQKVLIKDHNYKIKFIGEVNEKFETNIKDFDTVDYQLDYPLDLTEETFNL